MPADLPADGPAAGHAAAPPAPITGQASSHADPVEQPPLSEPDPDKPAPGPVVAQGSELDPDIEFVWTETLPGRGTCDGGVYVGSFECMTSGVPSWPVSGQIVFSLEGSSETQMLSVVGGSFADATGLLFTAQVIGSLDCLSNGFAARTVGGQAFTVDPTLLPESLFIPTFRAFETSLDGAYDDQSRVIDGELSMRNDLGRTCDGTWNARAQP